VSPKLQFLTPICAKSPQTPLGELTALPQTPGEPTLILKGGEGDEGSGGEGERKGVEDGERKRRREFVLCPRKKKETSAHIVAISSAEQYTGARRDF